jgi:hypothetical protein
VPTFGCAYWGRDATTADDDFASLADIGFSWVVIPVSTERMQFDRAGGAAVIAAAKRRGLATRIAPWGVGGIIPGDAQYLYINPDRSAWPAIPATASLAGIGIDAYRDPAEAIARLPKVWQRYDLPVHVWVRNFGLLAEQTSKPANDLRVLCEAGVTDIGVWGFPAAGCSCLDNAEPQRAWDEIVETIVHFSEAQAA